MMDSDGNVVVYIGQPWNNPKGTLVEERGDNLIIDRHDSVRSNVSKAGFLVSHMPYEKYAEWKKDFSGLPKEIKEVPDEPFERFDIMDFDDEV